MKKLFLCVLTAGLLLSLAGCASSGSGSSGGIPSFVNEAIMNAPEDSLVGIGNYKTGGDPSKIGIGKTIAETRARADITRQLQTILANMVTDFTKTTEVEPSAAVSFQEDITQTLSKADLRGSRVIKIDTDKNGILWIVMQYDQSAATEVVNQAVNAAKLKVPQAEAFDALERMDAAFNKEAGGGPIPVSE
jgi:hypothetical protein